MANVTCDVVDGIAQVRLNRPDKLNALTLPFLEELVATAHELRRDKTLRAVIVAGEGDAFCAGLDFASVMKNPAGIAKAFAPRPWRSGMTNTFQEAPWAFRRIPVPVIAAVHGHCLGGGIQIALAADFRVATPDSRWSVLEGKWGLIPDMSGIRSLAEQIGMDQAKWLTMSAEVIDGSRAAEIGLVTRLSNDPLAEAQRMAEQLAGRSPDALGRRQAALQRHLDRVAAQGLLPRADRAGLPARRAQHQGRPRGRVQEGRAGLRPPRPLKETDRGWWVPTSPVVPLRHHPHHHWLVRRPRPMVVLSGRDATGGTGVTPRAPFGPLTGS